MRPREVLANVLVLASIPFAANGQVVVAAALLLAGIILCPEHLARSNLAI